MNFNDGGNIRALADAQPFEGGQPVHVLGQDPDDALCYYFLTSFGRIKALPAHQIQLAQVEGLYGGDTDWLVQHFPRTKAFKEKDSDTGEMVLREVVVGWQVDGFRQWVQKEAVISGVFSFDKNVRGPGVYLPDPDGSSGTGLINHSGNVVRHGGEWRPAGHKYGPYVYPLYASEPRPSDTAEATRIDGRDLLSFLETWNFAGEYTATLSEESEADLPCKLLLGWMATAMVTGALRKWRPHIYLTGEASVGKTTLVKLIRGVLGGNDLCATVQDPSAAGIRQQLNSFSRALMVDECEQKAGSTKAADVLELARLASAIDGGGVPRGSPGGRSVVWYIRASFLFSGINPPRLGSADVGRVTMVELKPHDQMKRVSHETLTAQLDGFIGKSAVFRSRMINRFEEFEASFRVLSAAIGDVGMSSRCQDQFGTLLAGYWTLTQDAVISKEAAADLVDGLQFTDIVDAVNVSMPLDCLRQLTMYSVAINHGSAGETVGEVISNVILDDGSFKEGMKRLERIGVRVIFMKGKLKVIPELRQDNIRARRGKDAPWVAVSTNPSAGVLSRIYNRETDWFGGAWSTQLLRLPGARTMKRNVRFAGSETKATFLPAELFLGLMDDEEGAPAFIKHYVSNSQG